METKTTDENNEGSAGLAATTGSPFADEWPYPHNDRLALGECLEVLERIMRDDLLVGVGTMQRRDDGKIELPLYGCARRALEHAKLRMENSDSTTVKI
jgi:hypothetical protein